MKALDFLDLVWGEREGWVDIPSKVNGHWVAWHGEWPEDRDNIERRINSALEDEEDIYFSVAQFTDRGRRIEDTLPSSWLWADLDEVTPDDCSASGYAPTIAWASSPNRYQALWRMDRELRPRTLEQLNRALSYTLGADRGGWDLTQVLRIPGTRNYKYDEAPTVEVVMQGDLTYHPGKLWRRVKDAAPVVPQGTIQQGTRKGKASRVPGRAKSLLRVRPEQVVEGERSARLWELSCLLAESGRDEEEIYTLVAPTPWNKWADLHTGERRLRQDIRKALRHVGAKSTRKSTSPPSSNGDSPNGKVKEKRVDFTEDVDLSEPSVDAEEASIRLPFSGYSDFMAQPMTTPRWLIEGIWVHQSHGIISGDPKTSKSLLTLAMGISVASGKPFLGEFPVHTTGPVLIVQEENSPWDVQDKMRKLSRFYGIIKSEDIEVSKPRQGDVGYSMRLAFPDDIPLHILNNWGYDMGEEEHREALETAIQEIQPVMVVLDPLYLMVGDADTDKDGAMRPYLRWLLHLRHTYGLAPIVVHHFTKSRHDSAGGIKKFGNRMAGTGALYRWVDSALYVEAEEPESPWNRRLRINREFRAVAPQKSLDTLMEIGEYGQSRMKVAVSDYSASGQLDILVVNEPGITLTQAAEVLGMDKRTVRKLAVGSEKIAMEGGGQGRGNTWKLYPFVEGKAKGEKKRAKKVKEKKEG